MSKKLMLLSLAAVSAAVLALPAAASAQTWHLNEAGAFTITGGTGNLSTTSGTTIHCGSVTGSGNYETTTTGTMTLVFGPTCALGTTHCESPGAATGVIETTALPFHNVMVTTNTPGVLVTPNATGAFAHFNCGFLSFTVSGNGVLGDVEKECGSKSVEAGVEFKATGHGVQEHTLYTGTTYRLTTAGFNAAQNTTGTIKFTNGLNRTIECTA